MSERVLEIGKVYNHFKNKKYKVYGITSKANIVSKDFAFEAIHTETNNKYIVYYTKYGNFIAINKDTGIILKDICVVYQALYGERLYYLRPYDMFMSKRDKKKYPKYTQEYRFELDKER